jgi:ubiquinone/menaquinone biosynthesis C-methylase UbiE
MATVKTNESVRVINASQQDYYEQIDNHIVQCKLDAFSAVLSKMKTRNGLRILDVGGASGAFALELRKMFPDKSCEIVVLDTTQYQTWTTHADKITFVQGSADDLTKLFGAGTFDLVIASMVFHHFVRSSYRKSVAGQFDIMRQIATILKTDGKLCVFDMVFNGMICDKSTSRVSYALTTQTFPPFVKVVKWLGAESAGVGVCLLSQKMWFDLFADANLEVESLQQGKKSPLPWYKKLPLLIKSKIWDNAFVVKKK